MRRALRKAYEKTFNQKSNSFIKDIFEPLFETIKLLSRIMLNLFIIIGLLSVLLSGCSNTANKLQAMWNIATDRSPAQFSGTATQSDNFVETQKHLYSDNQIVSGNRLSKKTKNQLIQASLIARKSGGNVHVVCPASATPEILQDIRTTGVTYYKDNAMNNGYIIIFSKKKN